LRDERAVPLDVKRASRAALCDYFSSQTADFLIKTESPAIFKS
jgi:hypothetical protein